MTPRLIYGFDPLCGWCFGYGPALRAVRTQWPDLQINLRMGGLVTGERIRSYSQMAGYISTASSRMKAVTGMALGQGFRSRILADPAVIASSIPPCDALLHLRGSAPEKVLDFAEALQQAHFGIGRDLNDPDTYAGIARDLGMEVQFDLPGPGELRQPLAAEFAGARALGLNSFPSLLLEWPQGRTALEINYDPHGMVDRIAAALAARPVPN
jgi:putative protein-disulfide isomerase